MELKETQSRGTTTLSYVDDEIMSQTTPTVHSNQNQKHSNKLINAQDFELAQSEMSLAPSMLG